MAVNITHPPLLPPQMNKKGLYSVSQAVTVVAAGSQKAPAAAAAAVVVAQWTSADV